MSNNYVEQMWQDQNSQRKQHGKSTRILGWTLGVIVALSAAAAASHTLWYPYVQPYLHF